MNKVRCLSIFLLVILTVNSIAESKESCDSVGTRIFEGRLEKNSFLVSMFRKYKFTLNDKKHCIAFIDTKNSNINDEILSKMLQKNVAVKGFAKYINEEPYLLIDAHDIYIKD